ETGDSVDFRGILTGFDNTPSINDSGVIALVFRHYCITTFGAKLNMLNNAIALYSVPRTINCLC
ncbi:MAG TPA: hypothetical protein ACFCUY_14565, partial [Xenococcaceae cyanobacterium]